MKIILDEKEVVAVVLEYLENNYGFRGDSSNARIYAYKNGIPSSNFEMHVFLEDEEKLT